MNAFELLKADHEKVAGLFEQLEAASGKAKIEVFNQINAELELHTHIEEKIFYPALEKPEETHDITLEAYEEHAVVKTLLKELSRTRNPDDEWEAKAKVLQENVEHHVEEEENELFEKAKQALPEQDFEVLGERMEAEKARRQQSPAARTSAKKSASKKGGSKKSSSAKKGSKKSASKSGKGGSKKSSSKGGTKKGGTKKGGTKKGAKKGGSKSSKAGKRGGTKKSAKKGRR
jgi:Hemerythrin HHE cation binding domain